MYFINSYVYFRGVLHDGNVPFDGVLETVQRLHEAGKELIVLSNSSKQQDQSYKSLQQLGFDPLWFTSIITSGQVTYHLLQGHTPTSNKDYPLAPQPWSVLEDLKKTNNNHNNKKLNMFCLGSGSGDQEYIELCGGVVAKDIETADLIVARGTFTILSQNVNMVDKTRDGDDAYHAALQDVLEEAARRQLPMIVANPDKVRPDGGRSPMPGQIGDQYNHQLLMMSGESTDTTDDHKEQPDHKLIKRIGKPFDDVYEIALRGKSQDERKRVCMVGDALETDVLGAYSQQIDGIWVVNNGIHNQEVETAGNGNDFRQGCATVMNEFHRRTDTYYAKSKNQKKDAPSLLVPAVIVPHFQW